MGTTHTPDYSHITFVTEGGDYKMYSWTCECGDHGMWHNVRASAEISANEHVAPTTRMGKERRCPLVAS